MSEERTAPADWEMPDDTAAAVEKMYGDLAAGVERFRSVAQTFIDRWEVLDEERRPPEGAVRYGDGCLCGHRAVCHPPARECQCDMGGATSVCVTFQKAETFTLDLMEEFPWWSFVSPDEGERLMLLSPAQVERFMRALERLSERQSPKEIGERLVWWLEEEGANERLP